MPRLGGLAHPFAFALEHLGARLVFALFLGEALGLGGEVSRVIAFIRHAAATIELKDPAGDIVEEVAIVGDDQNRPGEFTQVALEPGGGFGIQMVGGFVEQQQVGLAQQQGAKRHAAAFTTRQLGHIGIARRAAQGLHRHLDLGFQIPQGLGVDLVLQLGGLIGGLVGIVHHQFVVAIDDGLLFLHPGHDIAEHIERRIKLGFLRQVTELGALGEPGFAGELGIDARHDLEQGRLTRAVRTQHADLGVRVE
ncbi:MAG: hypothetical protein K0R85_2025 [Devosia sp.]|nr:hypothetical protein [Devosia sp.]